LNSHFDPIFCKQGKYPAICTAADGDHSHGGSTMTTMIGSRISMASGKYQLHNLLFIYVKEPIYLNLYCNKKDNADGPKITNYIER
jgi:hypothetical protein